MEIKEGTLVVVGLTFGNEFKRVAAIIGSTNVNENFCKGKSSYFGFSGTISDLVPLCQTKPEEADENPNELINKHLPEVIINLAQRIFDVEKQLRGHLAR